MLLAALSIVAMSCATAPPYPREVVFARARIARALPVADEALGTPVKVAMPFWDARVALFDAKGHVAVVGIEASAEERLALPFSEPVSEVSISSNGFSAVNAICARTKSASLECLYFNGDVLWALRTPEQRARVKRLEFPSLKGRVDALGTPIGPCVVQRGTTTCAEFRIDGYGANEKLSLVAAHTVEAPARSVCRLNEGVVDCEGVAAFGQLGDGTADEKTRTSLPALEGPVAELVSLEHASCARLERGEVRCWGLVPSGWKLSPEAKERLPLCQLDRKTMDETWKKRLAEEQEMVKQCAATCSQRKVLDACLGCVAHGLGKQPVFVHGDTPCEEPRIIGDPSVASWPTPEQMPTQGRFVFSSKPAKLMVGGPVVSLAAAARGFCALTDDGALHCASN